VIVVDNAGSESTRVLVEGLGAVAGSKDAARGGNPGPGQRSSLYYLRACDKPGPAAARNAGWRFAHGGIIAFTDDDCVPQMEWITEGEKAIEAGYDVVNGRVIVPRPVRPTDYEKNTSRLETAEFLTANCFVRFSALEAVGGFDERFQTAWREDSDLQFKLMEQGRKIGREPSAVVVHPVRKAPWGVSLREQRKSMYNALLFRKHPLLYRQRIQRVPPWRPYATVLSALVLLGAALTGESTAALVSGLLWVVLTALFAAERLRGATHRPSHVAEMILTSILIPPLSVFWRLYGAVKYRVWFC
jgi:GT2 family glycosyltransferase